MNALRQTVTWIYLLHCSLSNFKYKQIWKAEYCKFSIIQYVHSSISFLRNKMFRKTKKELQMSYNLVYHCLTQTWNCSCETDIEVTKCDLEDISDFKTEECFCTWFPTWFSCAKVRLTNSHEPGEGRGSMHLLYLTERVLITLGTCTAFTTSPAPCKTARSALGCVTAVEHQGEGWKWPAKAIQWRQWRKQNLSAPDFQSPIPISLVAHAAALWLAKEILQVTDWLTSPKLCNYSGFVLHHFKRGQLICSPCNAHFSFRETKHFSRLVLSE